MQLDDKKITPAKKEYGYLKELSEFSKSLVALHGGSLLVSDVAKTGFIDRVRKCFLCLTL